jgi:TonB family protein
MTISNRSIHVRRFGLRLLQAAAVALVISFAVQAHAADDRTVKSRVAPIYPEIAKRMKIGGEVKVQATVDATGKVTEAKAVTGNHMLAVAAEDAVRHWKFEPGAGETTVNVAINFNIGQ